ncbi:hypothetical protein SAMN02745823_00279 [Sporobacter termitidis DSM 10068]|uniref:Uncharacterized protein n=1 Tax=Sporobacter termitidis DSM 10068 TaxID=1123282 RepID=A0A1M5TY73_9FIRM|nr:hypothetical protein [Sporobacter termitidis]SHH55644.1 hypothetical protein SAMN02745823_00279 [Sporobacter termitidis DSM 10068]
MNKKTGMLAALVTLAAVAAFALGMAFGSSFVSFLASMFIAWGFVPLVCAFAAFGGRETSAVSKTAVAFASVYAVLIMLVYFAQLTTVRMGTLAGQAALLLDYANFGLMFNYDLLGYAFMALATFFIAFAVQVKTTADRWLKGLLLAHGVFAVSCVVIPMLGVFGGANAGGALMGTLILEFWCAYFIPVCILSFVHFKRKENV